MDKAFDEIRKIIGNVPWLTPNGVDFSKYPIDLVLKKVVGQDGREFRDGLGLLQAMHQAGRQDAGIFLLGLLAHSGEDWNRREEIVERLYAFNTRGCADYLLGELRRVKADNRTRRYLYATLKVLTDMPAELVGDGLMALATDRSFTPRMREKFMEAWETAEHKHRPLSRRRWNDSTEDLDW